MRDTKVMVRLNDVEKVQLEKMAKAAGYCKSEYLRLVAIGQIPQPKLT